MKDKSGAGRGVRQAARDRPSTLELLGIKPVTSAKDPSTSDRPKSKTSERCRVWWPPTKDKKKSGYSGAYWEAAVLKKSGNRYEVQYDNGDAEKVSHEHIFPADVPVGFGKDVEPPIRVGEFVEVSNDSETDPCAWLGVVSNKLGSNFEVSYPFHDSPSEVIKPSLIRRARVWDNKSWRFIQTGQTWEAGEVTSPKELFLLKEKDYYQQLKAEAGGASKSAAKRKKLAAKEEEEASEEEDDSSEEAEEVKEEQAAAHKPSGSGSEGASKRKPGRSRKPVVPRPSELSTEEQVPAKKRGRPAKGKEEPAAKKRKPEDSSKVRAKAKAARR